MFISTPQSVNKTIFTSLALATAVSSVGLAQPTYAESSLLEEVIVTARKREETLAETPVAVSALSGDMLGEIGARDVSDLRKVVPNLDVYGGNGTGGAGNFFIRGIGARNTLLE